MLVNIYIDGTYKNEKAHLYDTVVVKIELGGNVLEKFKEEKGNPVGNNDDLLKYWSGWFKFVQTEDGSVPAVFHSREENAEILNIKKAIAAAFQANFEGTQAKMEADPQSVHLAEYRFVTVSCVTLCFIAAHIKIIQLHCNCSRSCRGHCKDAQDS